MITLRLTSDEHRAVAELIRYALMSTAARNDEGSFPLRSALKKLRDEATKAYCTDCGKPKVYAKERCGACYKKQLRKREAS